MSDDHPVDPQVGASEDYARAKVRELTMRLEEAQRSQDFDAVGAFHHKFDLPSVTHNGPDPHLISRDVAAFRWRFLMEEMTELLTAMNHNDLPEIADALVDLVYVALGTAHYYRLPWNELFAEVQRTNMLKERAELDGSNSKRSSALDVVKPPGWRPPDIAGILEANGWEKGK